MCKVEKIWLTTIFRMRLYYFFKTLDITSVRHKMSRNYLIRGKVSRIVRGQNNFGKMTFFKVWGKFLCMTEFAADKWFCLLFPKEKWVEPKVNPEMWVYTARPCLKYFYFLITCNTNFIELRLSYFRNYSRCFIGKSPKPISCRKHPKN